MIVDSNSAAPLKYTDPTFQALLFVRANIYDTSGVSPVLASTVNLTLLDNGVYWGKFTYTAGKTYLAQKLVYTDGTYATVDQTFAQDNDDVQCIDLKTAQLDAAVSSCNSTAHFDAVIGSPAGASIAADIAEIELETDSLATAASLVAVANAVAAIPTTPVLTAHFDSVIGTPAGASIAADLVEIEGETDGIAAIPTNPLLTNDARLNHLDADVSSREADSAAATREAAVLAAISGIPAPDNVGIAAIEAKTNNLPVDPAATSDVSAVITALTTVNTNVLSREADTAAATREATILAAITGGSTILLPPPESLEVTLSDPSADQGLVVSLNTDAEI